MPQTPYLRRAARAILLDPDHRVLLVRFRFSDRDVWCAPGGGIDPGEDAVAALQRELLEETGLELAAGDLGRCVAHRVHLVPLKGGFDGQEEWFHCARVPAFVPRGQLTAEQLRAENLHEVRWWAVDDLRATLTGEAARGTTGTTAMAGDDDAQRLTVTAPRDLVAVLDGWLTDGVPTEMVELDV